MSVKKPYIIIFTFFVFSNWLYCQDKLNQKVIEKFSSDSISLSQFQKLGNLNCQDKLNGTSLLENYYYELYNDLNPFPRLYNIENLNYFFNEINVCEFDKSHYLNFISNQSNLLTKSQNGFSDNEIQRFKKDFLENYYIKINSD